MSQTLHGACACGRNRYTIDLPHGSLELAEVQFDTSNATRRHHTAPFTAWLRVPLDWYRSATFAQLPDETHPFIRRTFESPFATNIRRQFCGFCGTQLSSWNESTPEEADFISLTLGSIVDEDVDLLEELGLLPSAEEEQRKSENLVVHSPVQELTTRGMPWFESIVRDTPFGRITKRKGGQTARDGSVKVEWEILEYTEGDDETVERHIPIKRKRDDAEKDDIDVVMH